MSCSDTNLTGKSCLLRRLAAPLAVCLALTAPLAHAQDIRSDVGASERINVAGQLATLSQRMIASACNVNSGISVRESQAVLQISAVQFPRIVDALLEGNRSFGILGRETRPRTLQVITDLNDAWDPLEEQTLGISVGAEDSASVAEMAAQSEPLLEIANILSTEITGQYADPVALLQADALLIDLAARQRMLAARMSKDICLIASGIRVEQSRAELIQARMLFNNTLSALRNGLNSLGVRPPPTQDIADRLDLVTADWGDMQPFIGRVLDGEQLTAEERQRVFFGFLGIESRMNNVTVSYDQNSKLDS